MSSLMRMMGIHSPKPNLAGFNLQSSVYGLPVPILYGRARLSGNIIHMPKQPVPVDGSAKGSGKGGGKGGGQLYQAPVAVGLCQGPIASIVNGWKDKDKKAAFSVFQGQGWSLKTGTSSQAAWSYLTSNYPSQAVPYQFTAYLTNNAAAFPNGQMSQYSWEVVGFNVFGGAIVDASPAEIIPDFLSAANYGANFPSSMLGSTTTFADYCAAAGLFCSPCFDAQQPARDHINEILEVANTAVVWSDGVLKFIPYGDLPLTANGHTYTPNTTPLYDLTTDDFLPNGEADVGGGGADSKGGDLSPIVVKRRDPSQAFNRVPIEFEDRIFDYNTSTYRADDQAAVESYGPITMPTLTLRSIKTRPIAQQVAQIRLQREQNVRNTYVFHLGWKFSLLEPMDLVTLTDTACGLSLTPVRIVTVTENAEEQGFTVVAEDWPFGTASATAYATGDHGGGTTDTGVDPGNTATPVIMEAPSQIALSPLDFLIAASGGTYWGGCEVWFSTDNSEFTKVGTIVGKAVYGTLTAALGSGAPWPGVDGGNTISVDVNVSAGTLSSHSATAFASLAPTCFIESASLGEFVAYQTAALTGVGRYNLTNLYRGLFNSTIPATHSVGRKFCVVDDRVLRMPYAKAQSAQVVYFKFPAFNIYGNALQDLASVSSISKTIVGDTVQFQNAVPQGTVSINSNGVWSATADAPTAATSFRWSSSTSAYPSDASVIASGTLVNATTFSITSGGTLAFGETIYITIVPFRAYNASGPPLPSIHIRGSYQTYSASKTIAYSVGSYRPEINTTDWTIVDGTVGCPNASTIDYLMFSTIVPVPAGLTITSVAQDVYLDAKIALGVTRILTEIARATSGGGYTSIGNASTAAITGWQTLTMSLSESSSTNQYYLRTGFRDIPAAPEAHAQFASFYVTYSMPDPLKTI